MLEKIGLPPKPSLRGNNWVVDATHCQGCSSQFTFINRKHHCRRCGGIFCNSCSQQRMVLRGQGDSPVRICEPCKRLEEAARFELRHGHKSRAGRGSSRSMSKQDDEVLNKILGNNQNDALLSGLTHNNDVVSSMPRETSSASCSNSLEVATQDMREEILGNFSTDESASPEELRQRASEEKKKYKTLKGQGKSEEALKAFKRGKDLERQADALELYLRKNRKKASPTRKLSAVQDKLSPKESVSKSIVEKDDLASELRELGWSDMDLREDEKKPAHVSLEGELFSLLGEVSQNTKKDKDSIDKTQVVAHKKKALMLKREGKVTEAKEELKKAKVLEKQIEEQALLAEAEESDDELSALIRSMDSDEQDDLQIRYGQNLDFDRLVGVGDDLGIDSNLDVTDEDMKDPEIAAALESFGWTEDDYYPENIVSQYAPVDREAILSEILSLKREALNKKRAGNRTEAMEYLKKAKILEGDLENIPSLVPENLSKSVKVNDENVNAKTVNSKVSPKSRLVIQKELLGLKKRALALRREGKLDEAEEELKKGKVLELQLEEIDNAPKVNAKPVQVNTWDPDLVFKNPDISSNLPLGDAEDDVTDQDLQDPTYLSLLSNLGWKEEDSDHVNLASQPSKPNGDLSMQNTDLSGTQFVSNNQARPSRRSKSEMQRELLSLKRKSLALRRQGKSEEAEEVLHMAKAIEAQMEEMEASKLQVQVESKYPIKTAAEEEDKVDVTEEDMNDLALLSVLNNLGWKDEEHKPINVQSESSEQISSGSINPSSAVSIELPRSKGEIQRELLGLKRKALALRRQGQTEEAEDLLRMSKALETQIEEMEAPKMTPDSSSNEKPGSSGSSNKLEKHENLKDVAGSETSNPQLQACADLINQNPQILVKGNPLLDHPDYARASESIASTYSPGGPMNSTFRLTGDDWSSTSSADTLQDKQNFVPVIYSLTSTPNQLGLLKESNEGLVSEDQASTKKRDENVHANEKQQIHEVNLGQGTFSPNNQSPLRHEILARKRKALALKREGKLAEAREELRQAKLLEKILDEGNSISVSDPNDVSVSVPSSTVTTISQKEHLAPKPLSGRDRFKLQQESLSHKRQAMKLRREGRMEEAEAEFELAKALENQLEESQESIKSNGPIDDVGVEDLLDPELLSALKAIGMGDATTVSERPEPIKHNVARGENSNQERVQLEERIKAEKVKAVNLKRSGKQAEALDALRRAKQLEKKLNALV